jgi:hypothetical protein
MAKTLASAFEDGVAFAIPDNAQMGARATSGTSFDLADKSNNARLKWPPTMSLNLQRLLFGSNHF